jgi:hypothetical protein
MRLYTDQKVLLRKNMKMATVIKKVTDKEKWIVSYYDENNKFVHDVISELDIIDDSEYEIIKRRINLINKILGEK